MTAIPIDATNPASDYRAILERQQRTWGAGDFVEVGSLSILHGELLCEALDIHPGERVLDVAAGNGAAAIAAARRWGDVTATDVVDHLLRSAERVAEAYGLALTTQVADAENLPFPDDSFDVVMSTFGTMFAPDQQRVADELVRVGRPGGRIGLANWAPVSLIGDVLRATGRHIPPAPGLRPAIEWGSEERLRELFGGQVRTLQLRPRQLTFLYPSPRHMLDHFRSWFGPTKVAFDSLDTAGRARLAADLIEVCSKHNRADDGTLVAPSDYVEVVAIIR
jgi:ubiquinone/menaquinone biosynthesis C-methylase UbiE